MSTDVDKTTSIAMYNNEQPAQEDKTNKITCPLCSEPIDPSDYPTHYKTELDSMYQQKQGTSQVRRSRRQRTPRVLVNMKTKTSSEGARKSPKRKKLTQECFICGEHLEDDLALVNQHIDQCLQEEGGRQMVEYEWGGQTRVRATAMLEGGPSVLGQSGMMGRGDEEVDVDAEDETNFGTSQYHDQDLIMELPPRGGGGGGGGEQPLEWEESAKHPAATQSSPPATTDTSQSLVVEALKERIRQQDRQLQAVQKCLVCLEPYQRPCTSINCWHVYCEACWLRTLGAKKLCPQCLQITQPTDLRRVYL